MTKDQGTDAAGAAAAGAPERASPFVITKQPVDRFIAADGSNHPSEEEALRQNLLLSLRAINDTTERVNIAWVLANQKKREWVIEAMQRCGILPTGAA